MSRIHPSGNKSGSCRLLCGSNHEVLDPVPSSPRRTTLTVWKRSSMSFQGTDGFTVYDRHGRLAFRVDNYSRNSHVRGGWSCSSLAGNGGGSGGGSGGALVLMDGSGKPLITLKPQIFSVQSQWNGCVYKEDDNGSLKSDRRIFMMRRPSSSVLALGRTHNQQPQCEAEVFFTNEYQYQNQNQNQNQNRNHRRTEGEAGDRSKKPARQADYRIEGSFWNRNCKIRSSSSGEVAAKIMRKRTTAAAAAMTSGSNSSSTIMLSEEVFSLVVNPGFDPQLMMAFVVILDRICFKPFSHHLICS